VIEQAKRRAQDALVELLNTLERHVHSPMVRGEILEAATDFARELRGVLEAEVAQRDREYLDGSVREFCRIRDLVLGPAER
jgi:hypothetical protein